MASSAVPPLSPKPAGAEKTLADYAPTLPLPADPKWKKDFTTTDLVVACVFGTAFVFLTVVDYSFDQFIWNQLTRSTTSASNPLVQSLGTYYEWRLTGTPLLCYWDLLFVILLPLILVGLIKENFDTIRYLRAPIGRHILDVESLIQVLLVVSIIVTKAKPTTEKVVAMIKAGGDKPDPALYTEITDMMNYHFLVFGLNALQWFVPFLRLVFQRKQDAMRIREASLAAATAAREAAAAERAAARAAKAAIPTFEVMQARMEAAEAMSSGKPMQQPQPEEGIKKRGATK